MDSNKLVKTVVLGDSCVGKTNLGIFFVTGSVPKEYIPTVFDNYSAEIEVDSQPIHLQIWDTAGADDYDRLRPLSYPNTHVFLICFSVVDPESLENVRRKWCPEVKNYSVTVPIVLVGLKTDLREDLGTLEKLKAKQRTPITYAQGLALSQEINAMSYFECSMKDSASVDALFEQVVRCVP